MRQKFITFIRALGLLCGLDLTLSSFYKYIINQPATKEAYFSAMIGWLCVLLFEVTIWITDTKSKKIKENKDNESNTK